MCRSWDFQPIIQKTSRPPSWHRNHLEIWDPGPGGGRGFTTAYLGAEENFEWGSS
jgi:hypothetical protein